MVSMLWPYASLAQSSGRDVRLVNAPLDAWVEQGFNPAESAGLFVGISRFADINDFPTIPYAVDDAIDLAHLFSLELGLIQPSKVVLILSGEPQDPVSRGHLKTLRESNALVKDEVLFSATDVLRDIQEQGRASGRGGLMVLSMATHGFSSNRGDFLVAANSLRPLIDDSGETGIRLPSVLGLVGESNALRRLVLLDTCRAQLTRSSTRESATAMAQSFADEIGRAIGQVVLLGATPGGVAYDDSERQNGVFTTAVIDGLQGMASANRRGYITVSTLADFAHARVQGWLENHRPKQWEHCLTTNGCGIERRIAGDAKDLPLAIEASRMRRTSDLERQRQEVFGLLIGHYTDEGPIDRRMLLRTLTLLEDPFLRGESLEELIHEIQKLVDTRESQHGLAIYLKKNLERLEEEAQESQKNPTPAVSASLLSSSDTASGLKVVGRSDNIPIVAAPGSSNTLTIMEPLLPYFVLEEADDHYRVSLDQNATDIQGFVAQDDVIQWNTREGLHFIESTFSQDRRRSVTAWDSEETIRRFAETGDTKLYGPSFQEQFQTRIGNRGVSPYPLLETRDILGLDGKKRRIHKVLIPAQLLEVGQTSVERVAGAVTFCIVVDATASMDKYARRFAEILDEAMQGLGGDTRLAAAGFVLFRNLKDAEPFEVVHPMPLHEASDWLRSRAKGMVGGDRSGEPVLDAVILGQEGFLWNGGTAIRGAARIMIVVANDSAHSHTIGLSPHVEAGLDVEAVASRLLRSRIPIRVISLQAGMRDSGNLGNVLSTLARQTGGDFYPATGKPEEISRGFIQRITSLIHDRHVTIPRLSLPDSKKPTIIPLSAVDELVAARLKNSATASGSNLIANEAWVFEDPTLYREKILIEKETLEDLIRFFNGLLDVSLEPGILQEGIAQILGAILGEHFDKNLEIQELLEKRLQIHFTTNILDFPPDMLYVLTPEEHESMRSLIQNSVIAMADFLDMNQTTFQQQRRVWMPVSYLP